ncbi:MAG: NAD-dependent epimerase/dehydratase family protein [Candidatus Liptonbacteria bacterium]|nr:NAD-dependent epimerase/dehydratase family protein [Candidatus Liptonbacteria bacterium]
MRILVTGGTGLVGYNLVSRLMKDGHDVLITGHDAEQKIPGFKGKYLQPSFLGLDWDAIGKVDAVFHEAAINDTENMDAREMMRANLDSSAALFEYVIKNGCKRIVYASSTAIYGNGPVPYKEDQPLDPMNPYAESKKLMEEKAWAIASAHPDVRIIGLRYCNIYGPGESHKGKRATMIYQLAQQMKTKNPRLFKDGEQKRDYIYVKDVVSANICALTAKENCVVNCGSGKATTFNKLVDILNKVMNTNRTPEYFENPIASRYQSYTECDMLLAKEKIGFVPEFNIEKGIADYAKTGMLF